MLTSPIDKYVPNPGMGYQVYSCEEKGTPDVPGQSEAEAIEKLLRLPFCDMVYMRTDWRVIQQRPGRLDLPEMWKYSVKLAKEVGKRISFRIQSSPISKGSTSSLKTPLPWASILQNDAIVVQVSLWV